MPSGFFSNFSMWLSTSSVPRPPKQGYLSQTRLSSFRNSGFLLFTTEVRGQRLELSSWSQTKHSSDSPPSAKSVRRSVSRFWRVLQLQIATSNNCETKEMKSSAEGRTTNFRLRFGSFWLKASRAPSTPLMSRMISGRTNSAAGQRLARPAPLSPRQMTWSRSPTSKGRLSLALKRNPSTSPRRPLSATSTTGPRTLTSTTCAE